MSWFTQFARAVGLGPVLDKIETAEKTPTLGAIAGAVVSVATAAPGVLSISPSVAIADLTSIVTTGVADAIAQHLPAGAPGLASELVPPLMSDIETLIAQHLAGGH